MEGRRPIRRRPIVCQSPDLMKNIVPTLCAVLALSSFSRAGDVIENPLQDLGFVYSEKNVRKSIKKPVVTRLTRIEHAFKNASGEGLRESFCPYLKSKYESGIVKISKGDRELILDFND